MTTFENQQIKGVTVGTFRTIIVSTAVTCSSILAIYYGLVTKIEKIGQASETNNKLIELRLAYLEEKMNALEIQINQIKQP